MRFTLEGLRVTLPPREQDLYFALVHKGKWVVTTDDAIQIAGVTHGYARKLLHDLHKRHALVRAGRGIYAVAPPEALYEEREPPIDTFRVLDQLMGAFSAPYYAAYMTAAYLHGGAHEIPFNVDVASPLTRRPIRLGQTRITLRKVRAAHMFGTARVRHAGEYLTVSDVEKTLLDCANRLDLCGGADGLAQIVWELAAKAQPKKLAQYAPMFSSAATVQRLGFVVAQLARKKPSRIPRTLYQALVPMVSKRTYPLDPARGDEGNLDAYWNVQVNVDVVGWLDA